MQNVSLLRRLTSLLASAASDFDDDSCRLLGGNFTSLASSDKPTKFLRLWYYSCYPHAGAALKIRPRPLRQQPSVPHFTSHAKQCLLGLKRWGPGYREKTSADFSVTRNRTPSNHSPAKPGTLSYLSRSKRQSRTAIRGPLVHVLPRCGERVKHLQLV